jgi:DNA-binding beta-propeller fold protein YncE
MSQEQTARVRAPEITGGRGWLNTDKPLSLAALKGKVVLLDFWTYGCINCIHIIPDLKKLEAKYANQLVVIGVHSAKFDNEKETENIRRIIMRYEIEHPVYNDADFRVWQSYAVRAWPTQVLIDPAGYLIGGVAGEGNYEILDQAIAKAIADFRKRGELNEEPLKLSLERAKVGDLPLAFPGKIVADEKTDRLFIADSNHNRIVVTKLDGAVLETIGNGRTGKTDGSYEQASFFRPQGMALDGEFIYVADTENHLVRRIDLQKRTVQTIAGTGEQTRDYFKRGPALTVALSSPWDLTLVGRTLYIAMAGPHQIWKLDLETQEVSTFAGSGREARLDGSLLEAGFAQPSGITNNGQSLFVADSESNIIRVIDIAKATVKTLVGGDLFEFGDVDGRNDDVRLQHPLGILALGDKLLIADTYNHKIKELDPMNQSVRSLLGTGKPGQADGTSPSFYEPAGLAVAKGKLYIADTNNHAIRVVDLKTKSVSTLRINGLQPPTNGQIVETSDTGPAGEEMNLPAQRVQESSDLNLVVNAELPTGYHLNPAAPQRYRISIERGSGHLSLAGDGSGPVGARTVKDLKLPLKLSLRANTVGSAEVRVQLTIFYCREDNTGTCEIKTLVWRVPIEIAKDAQASTEIRLNAKVRSG